MSTMPIYAILIVSSTEAIIKLAYGDPIKRYSRQ